MTASSAGGGLARLVCALALAGCRWSNPAIAPVATDGAAPPVDAAPGMPARDAGFTFVFPDAGPTSFDPPPARLPPPGWNCGAGCFADPAVSPAQFGGRADPVGAPRIAYPLNNSLHPINIADLTFQWRRTVTHASFRIHLAGRTRAYDFYVPCGKPADALRPLAADECAYALPGPAWVNLAAENRGEPVEVTIASTDGKTVATSTAMTLSFSPGVVEGGLYFWSTALQGMYRLVFGSRKAVPFIVPGSTANRFSCGGCHAVSRDGNVIAFSAEQDGFLTVARTSDPARPTIAPAAAPVPDGNMMTLNRDGSRVLVSYGVGGDNGRVVVRDTATGAEVARLDPAVLGMPERKVYFPEWSPDGMEIVATLASQDERPWSVNNGYLVIIPYNEGRFGPARVVVPREAGAFHFYPTWSPDGRWIAFTSAPIAVKSYDNPNARLRLVSREGGRIYELTRATQSVGRTSTWPKFAPFRQAGGQLFFLTFNSKLDYGLMLKNSAEPAGFPQLWLAAVDLRLLDTGDPSHAPIWLPFQELAQRNHLGFWTERVPCTDASKCGVEEVCENGACVPIIQ